MLERLNNKRDCLNKLSESKYIFYDKLLDEISLSEGSTKLLEMALKKNYSLHDIEQVFGDHWANFSEVFEENYPKIRSYNGILELAHGLRQISYRIEIVNDASTQINGVVIFLRDISEESKKFNQVCRLMNQYRQMSFNSDLIFNSLPIPIWAKSSNGDLLYYNKALEDLCQEFGRDEIFNSINELGNADSNHKKMYLKNSTRNSIRFQQSLGTDELSIIGFAMNLNEHEEVEKKLKNLSLTLEKVMELSINAILVVNSQGRINIFNHGFANLFELDFDWLMTKPYYSQVLDKMREKGKLPEMKDYKEFKDKQLKLLSEIVPTFDYWHLISEQTIRYAVIPIDARSTLFIFNDVTEELKVERVNNTLLSSIRDILETYQSPTIIFGPEGRIKLCNSKAYDYFNIPQGEILDNLDFKTAINNSTISKAKRDSLVSLVSEALNRPIKESLMISSKLEAVVNSLVDFGIIVTFIKH